MITCYDRVCLPPDSWGTLHTKKTKCSNNNVGTERVLRSEMVRTMQQMYVSISSLCVARPLLDDCNTVRKRGRLPLGRGRNVQSQNYVKIKWSLINAPYIAPYTNCFICLQHEPPQHPHPPPRLHWYYVQVTARPMVQ